MSRIAYVNGRYVRVDDAAVSIEDRGYQFADGVYEVCVVINGKYWDADDHLARLQRSLDALQIAEPMERNSLRVVMDELLCRNCLSNALVYIQVTRGVAPRNHLFPGGDVGPALVLTARPFDLDQNNRQAATGICVTTAPDIRWGRVDIKTIGLLPNVLAKQAAHETGAAEVWLQRDGRVTEGSASNAWIVDNDGALHTHPKTNEILGGITRATTLKCARELQIKVYENAFSVVDAKSAREAFLTSATGLVTPIVKIDDAVIGDGAPGPVTLKLRQAYKAKAQSDG